MIIDVDDEELAHFGVKGMHWGVKKERQDLAGQGKTASPRKIAKLDKRFEKLGGTVTLQAHLHNAGVDEVNHNLYSLNKKYEGKDLRDPNSSDRKKYDDEYTKMTVKILQNRADRIGTNASGTKKYEIEPHPTIRGAWRVNVVAVRHAADGESQSFTIKATRDAMGFITKVEIVNDDGSPIQHDLMSVDDFLEHSSLLDVVIGADDTDDTIDDFLEHFGVKGMHWGIKKTRTPGVALRVDRQAHKDAKEFTTAKLYFGEGAGTRRKLINARVEGRSKSDPSYAKAFDHHLSNQNPSDFVDRAKHQRHRVDVKPRNRRIRSAAFSTAVIAGSLFLQSEQGRAALSRSVNNLSNK